MIGISRLLMGTQASGDRLRYEAGAVRKPVVVWTTTIACNLDCAHCYAADDHGQELTTAEAQAFLADLAAFGAPVILFSGGEPLLRPDLVELVGFARDQGLRPTLSTNGTLLDRDTAAQLKDAGLIYAGLSIDGAPETHDRFRGLAGAFDATLAGIRACRAVGLKVGLRFTLTAGNATDLDTVFDLALREGIDRVCVYHLAYAGRGRDLDDLEHAATRAVVDRIIDRTRAAHALGHPLEVLTVDNHCDGPFTWMRLEREGHARAEAARELLMKNGGNQSGSAIACVGVNGEVHPDQFWRRRVVGNIRQRPFSEIWSAGGHPLLDQLRDRRAVLPPRCQRCRFLPMCNGNLRVRAEVATGDPWGFDPACYLTDEEIAG